MNKRIIIAASLLLAGLVTGYAIGQFGGDEAVSTGLSDGERRVLYWQSPMDPGFRSDKPGKSPMGMDLIPIFEGEELDQGESVLRISPAMVNNLGVRTAPAVLGRLGREIDTVGFIAPNDDLTSHVHVRVEGWVERLLVKTEGERVKKG
ncbi:MAG: efflux RND transporter periplasmic adaptor subunit, partial [Proteobacteria bacterium]|nr:efflux RND transporter periplasmic adaptor subunit [Pseudomonadota bacterium]